MSEPTATLTPAPKDDASVKEARISSPFRAAYYDVIFTIKQIRQLQLCIIGLVIVICALAITLFINANKKPFILYNDGNGYQQVALQNIQYTRKDLEHYVNFVIPNLYGILNGQAPGLDELQEMLNPHILDEQKKAIAKMPPYLKSEGSSQFAIVTGINPETVVIDPAHKLAYLEALGTIVLNTGNQTKRTNVQWRCLMYLVDPTKNLSSQTPAGKLQGNRLGIYLQQIEEQTPGFINKDSPKPTRQNLQELAELKDLTAPAQLTNHE